jgi:hypothetical protein
VCGGIIGSAQNHKGLNLLCRCRTSKLIDLKSMLWQFDVYIFQFRTNFLHQRAVGKGSAVSRHTLSVVKIKDLFPGNVEEILFYHKPEI